MRRLILISSLGANVLLAVLMLSRRDSVEPPLRNRVGAVPRPPVTSVKQFRDAKPPAVANLDGPGPFQSWAALESPDNVAYASNLRAFGCPEETIAYLLEGRLDGDYDRRWQGINNYVQSRGYLLNHEEWEGVLEAQETLRRNRQAELNLLLVSPAPKRPEWFGKYVQVDAGVWIPHEDE